MKENATLKFKETSYFTVSIKNKYSKEWKKKKHVQ